MTTVTTDASPTPAPEGQRVPLPVRMKELEHATRTVLPARSNTMIRVDGKAFHTYTRGLDSPFDAGFTNAMTATAVAMCEQIDGAVCAYVQSDEISVLIADYQSKNMQAWLGGVHSKVISLTAAIATAEFNRAHTHPTGRGPALFDSRAFTIDDPSDVTGYFVWRQRDARRNAISMISDTHLGKKATIGVDTEGRISMLAAAGVQLTDFPEGNLTGRLITPVTTIGEVTFTHKRTGVTETVTDVARTVWTPVPAPDFRDRDVILSLLPARPDADTGM